MVEKRVPQVCIYCKNFPCIEGDDEHSVISEIGNSYPFLSEDDASKPCGGSNFEPVDFSFEAVMASVGEEALRAPIVPVPKEAAFPTEKTVYILKGSDQALQAKIDKITGDEDIVDYRVAGMTAAYDSASAKMDIILALEITYKKPEKIEEDLQNSPENRE